MAKATERSCMAALPHDIMIDILSRLPVKTLSKLRCVSKSWCNLISDPLFLQSHRDGSKQNLRFLCISNNLYPSSKKQERNFYHNGDGNGNHSACKFTSMDREGNVLNAFTAKVSGDGYLWVLPTCCDLVCFVTIPCKFYLCNPSTQQILALPRGSCPPSDRILVSIGFGYLPSTKEYKVVQLYRKDHKMNNGGDTIYCEVFTLGGRGGGGGSFRTSSWRKVKESCPYMVELFGNTASINGTIYWRISFGSFAITREEELIVSFDTEHEKFRTISYPANLPYINKKKTRIMELGGRLCLVDTKSASISSTMVIWTLKDYDNCIWVKGYSIDMAANWDIRFVLIAKDMSNGEIILGPIYGIMYFYNSEKRSFRKVPVPSKNIVGRVGIYWEGFFSLGSRG